MPKWWEIAKDNAAAKVSKWWEKDSSLLPVESKSLVEVKTPILKESSWLNMDAIHFIESTNGKDKKVYKKDGKTYNDSIPAIGEYQIKPSTFRDPGQRLINKYGSKYNHTRHNIGKDWLIAASKPYCDEFSYKEKFQAEIATSLAIAGYSRGFPKIKNLVKKHGLWTYYYESGVNEYLLEKEIGYLKLNIIKKTLRVLNKYKKKLIMRE